ncbi:hypothetical protein G8A07_00360 [Roseateles sp. DAIF2]|uniref:YciI family protein n=1 Tax=Roseateles sp. DAIF2 TaxID=2714952 RepID=UPI0018A310CE|nr:YciI family protein [Roseateles sp. DAIF2]QPF71523.1 hypothetical protein G8A07_00360 [Roseateles sp. DAIF2]
MTRSAPSTADAQATEFLVLSRGQWDPGLSPEAIQAMIDAFYRWYEQGLAEGSLLPGQRLARAGRRLSRRGVLDGPFAETKELVGGYWFVRAASLEAAAALLAGNPCLAGGLEMELRPLDYERASAYALSCERPQR